MYLVNKVFEGLFLPAGNNFRLAYARNLKLDMEVALHKNIKKKILNKQWLLWLPDDVITNLDFYKNRYVPLQTYISRTN